MVNNSLMYYNRAEDTVAARKVLAHACALLLLEMSELSEDWADRCQIGVIHGTPVFRQDAKDIGINYYSLLSGSDVSSHNDLAVIFLSSVTAPEDKRAKAVRFLQSNGKEGVRYLLPIRRTLESGLALRNVQEEPDEETVNKWVSLLEAVTTPGVLEEWFKAPGSAAVNSILNEMLLEPMATEALVALSVLCQGYLAVHAFNEKGEPQSREFGEALRDSGVESVVGDPTLVLPQLATVANPAWWQEVFGGAKLEFERGVAREWGIIDLQQCPKALRDLIGAIYSDESISPQVVAEGYLAIAKRLRTA